MRIKHVTLQNFKFHSDLTFDLSKKNCLIYGENGTGKSSAYEAFYAVFKTYFRNNDFDFQKFQKSGTSDLRVEIVFDNNRQLILPNDNYALLEEFPVENKNTIYFANHDLLEFLVGYENNFYITIDQYLKKYFDQLEIFCATFDAVNSTIDSLNHKEENEKRQKNSEQMGQFLTQVTLRANDIIQNHFKENFELSFQYDWGMSDTTGTYEFPTPKITLQIDNKDNLKLNFNEAKLKLASIVLFFALIKLAENPENPLKLLVLDDFLTSLDMANRHYIMEYIFTEFSDYQKIILTHNLQFYNLIIRLIKSKINNNWDIKNIFLAEGNQGLIYNKEENYLKKAKKQLLDGEFHISGNYARKEFERINNEFKQILELGKQESLNNILETLKSQNDEEVFKNPSKKLEKLRTKYLNIKTILSNENDNKQAKVGKIKYEIKQIIEELETDLCNLSGLKSVLNQTEFYKNILFNPASHNDEEKEIYRKECINSIKLLEELNEYLKRLKG